MLSFVDDAIKAIKWVNINVSAFCTDTIKHNKKVTAALLRIRIGHWLCIWQGLGCITT